MWSLLQDLCIKKDGLNISFVHAVTDQAWKEHDAEIEVEDGTRGVEGPEQRDKAAGQPPETREPSGRRAIDDRDSRSSFRSTIQQPLPQIISSLVPRAAFRPSLALQPSDMPPQPVGSPSSSQGSATSDKENRNASRRASGHKRPAMEASQDDNAAKRRRTGLAERNGPAASQAAMQKLKAKATDTRYYDPEQPREERREVRKKLRDQHRDIQDSRHELMASGSDGIRDMFKEHNKGFKNVKQTDDATLDSRNIVMLGDIAYKAVLQNTGGTENGLNVDDFISKTMAFMRRGPSDTDATQIFPPNSSQRQGRRPRPRAGADSDASDDEAEVDEGDAMNWEWLGRKAGLPSNMRAPVPALLLGPLSVRKKIRKVTQRVARQRVNPEDAVRPEELKVGDIERNENENAVSMCKMIYELLVKTNTERGAAAEAECAAIGEATDAEMLQILEKYELGSTGGCLLANFAFHPRDFGQTVENLFYISFLIKENKVGLELDENGMQTLSAADNLPGIHGDDEEVALKRQQGVFHIDHQMWEDTCRLFNITACIIPHRERPSAESCAVSWYH